jgi:catechol 2,3-dioxygenase-like lactoylglutathione lyase family enzyme
MIKSFNHITLAVTDIDRSFAFYRDVLGLKPLVKWGSGSESGGAYFLVGDSPTETWFCLNVDPSRTSSTCYTHYAFSVSADEFDAMSKRILESGATVFKDNTSPGESLYFLDPDGHKLEIHVGNWQTRITAKKADSGSWKNVEWFV